MVLTYTSEQVALAESVKRFVEREYVFAARRNIIESDDGFSEQHWATFAELGWLGAGLPEEAGGFGGDLVDYAIIAEQLGRGLVIEPYTPAVLGLLTLSAIDEFDGRAALVEAIILGQTRVMLAHFEKAGRGDIGHVETRAEPLKDGWVLTGTKTLVAGAPAAHHLLVSAQLDDDIGLFLVERTAPGLAMASYRAVDNSRVADLRLDRVPARRIAPDALNAIERAIDHATILLCAEAVGAMEAALWMTRDYLKTRRQFGQALGSFQALQHRMADMLVQCELARSILYAGLSACALGTAKERRAGVSAAKLLVGEAGLFVGQQAIQLHGGIGMTEEYAVGHYYKRLFAIAHLLGNGDRHLERFAASVLEG